ERTPGPSLCSGRVIRTPFRPHRTGLKGFVVGRETSGSNGRHEKRTAAAFIPTALSGPGGQAAAASMSASQDASERTHEKPTAAAFVSTALSGPGGQAAAASMSASQDASERTHEKPTAAAFVSTALSGPGGQAAAASMSASQDASERTHEKPTAAAFVSTALNGPGGQAAAASMSASQATPQSGRHRPSILRPVEQQALERFADLAVDFSANVQPGQIVAIEAETGMEPIVRAVAERAYERGARFVDPTYFDPYVKRARLQ